MIYLYNYISFYIFFVMWNKPQYSAKVLDLFYMLLWLDINVIVSLFSETYQNSKYVQNIKHLKI